jgi:hypothetical protein
MKNFYKFQILSQEMNSNQPVIWTAEPPTGSASNRGACGCQFISYYFNII